MASRDDCVAKLAEAGLSYKGTTAELRNRLLNHLMSKNASMPMESLMPAETTSNSVGKKKDKKDKKDKKPRTPTAYNAFVKAMVPIVINDGYKGKEVLKQVAELWKRQKHHFGGPKVNEPCMLLTYNGASEELVGCLMTLGISQLRANLALYGDFTTGTKEELAKRLSCAMLG